MTQDLWQAVDSYFEQRLLGEDAALAAALAASDAAGLPQIAVSPLMGKLLQLLVAITGARRVLEVGTLAGYSSLWLARALPQGGRIVTLERVEAHSQVARANVERAGLSDRVEVRVGPALDGLAQLSAEGFAPIDLAFIDADKENNWPYVDWAIRLGRSGTLILVDNVVREGRVLRDDPSNTAVMGVRRMLHELEHDARVEATALQTVGAKGHDGFALIRVK